MIAVVAAAAAALATGAVCTSEKLGKPPMASMTCDVTFHNPDDAPRWVLVAATIYVEGPKPSSSDDSIWSVDVTHVAGVDVVKLSSESARNEWAVLVPAAATVTVRGLPFSRVGFPAKDVTDLALPSRRAAAAHLDDPTLTPPLAAVKPATAGADVRWSTGKPGPRAQRDGFSGVPLKLEAATAVDARLRLPAHSP